jgi:hypothetical protein
MCRSELEGYFPAASAASASSPHDATRSDNLDFWNATNADLDRNASSSASVCSLSRQHCLTFQRLGLSRAIGQRDADGAIRCLPGKRNPV